MIEHSENLNELAAALAKAQAEIDNPSKNSANPFFKSKYADLAEVLSVVRPAFSANGLSVTQHPSIRAAEITLTTMLLHASGQWLKSSVTVPSGKDIQATGGIITYLRRYSLSAIAGVAQEDDDGEGASRDNQDNKACYPSARGPSTPPPSISEAKKYQPKTAPGKARRCATTGKLAPAYCGLCGHKDNCPEEQSNDEHDVYDQYIVQIDKLETIDDVISWNDTNLHEAQKNLSPANYNKLKSYINQVVDMLGGEK